MIHNVIDTGDPIHDIKHSFKTKYGIEHDIEDRYNTWVSIVIPIVISLEK